MQWLSHRAAYIQGLYSRSTGTTVSQHSNRESPHISECAVSCGPTESTVQGWEPLGSTTVCMQAISYNKYKNTPWLPHKWFRTASQRLQKPGVRALSGFLFTALALARYTHVHLLCCKPVDYFVYLIAFTFRLTNDKQTEWTVFSLQQTTVSMSIVFVREICCLVCINRYMSIWLVSEWLLLFLTERDADYDNDRKLSGMWPAWAVQVLFLALMVREWLPWEQFPIVVRQCRGFAGAWAWLGGYSCLCGVSGKTLFPYKCHIQCSGLCMYSSEWWASFTCSL